MDGDLHRAMKSTFFDRGQDLVLIEAHLVGPRSDARLNLVFDTGANNTIVTPDVIDQVGYSARHGHGFRRSDRRSLGASSAIESVWVASRRLDSRSSISRWPSTISPTWAASMVCWDGISCSASISTSDPAKGESPLSQREPGGRAALSRRRRGDRGALFAVGLDRVYGQP